MVSQKGRQAQTSLYLPVEMLERLQQLSKRTRVPMAAYLREAVEDLLNKHETPASARQGGKSKRTSD